jgi:N-formylglutamate amidohydrolase
MQGSTDVRDVMLHRYSGEWITAHFGVPDEEVVKLQKRWSS